MRTDDQDGPATVLTVGLARDAEQALLYVGMLSVTALTFLEQPIEVLGAAAAFLGAWHLVFR